MFPKQPETDMVVNHSDTNKKIKRKRKTNKIFDVAPGQGKIPTNWARDPKHDITAFPELFPLGKGGINEKREVKLTKGDFYSVRFLNHDKMYVLFFENVFSMWDSFFF